MVAISGSRMSAGMSSAIFSRNLGSSLLCSPLAPREGYIETRSYTFFMPRPPAIHHCTSHPARFFGREAELRLLDDALHGGETSVAAMIGPGGQGKTAIVQ